jgi:predicted PurR-regulated permease PerM
MKGLERDLTRTLLAICCLVLLVAGSLWVLRPFFGPTIWATMVVVATWPLMLRVQAALWNRRSLAVVVMTLLLLLLFVVPLVVAIGTIVGNVDRIVEWARLAAAYEVPDHAPPWLAQLPVVGSMLAGLWEQAAAAGLKGVLAKLSPYAGNLTRWFVAEVGSLGLLLVQFLVTVVVAALLYAHGESAALLVRRLAARVAGERGEHSVELAGGAIRGVALGVGITAIVQSLLGGVGLAIAGIPAAALLTAAMFLFCIAQAGPLPVLVPAIVWLFWNGQTGMGICLVVVAAVAGTLDNVLRPLLIRLGADIPLPLIFVGVIGGLLAFGLVGIFVGPVVLAVGWTLLDAWMDERAATNHSDAG